MFIKGIRVNDLVLEVGSGHNPYPRSDILLDKYLENKERASNIVLGGRPLVLADVVSMPFKDKSFDFVICSHILEHVENIQMAISEIQRVGKAGYIETPTEIWEAIFKPRDYHKWIIMNIDDQLLIRRKEEYNAAPFGALFDLIAKERKCFSYIVMGLLNGVFITTYYWKNNIKYEVISSTKFIVNFRDEKQLYNFIQGKSYNIIQYVIYKLYRKIGLKVPNLIYPFRLPHRKISNLVNIMQCPRCKGELYYCKNLLKCTLCSGEYPIINGIIYFNEK